MTEQLQMIDVEALRPWDDNPRGELGDLEELATSIAAQGILEPLIASPNGDGFVVVMGNRRLAAAKKAGVTELPVVIREMDNESMLEAALVENLQRKDLEPLEEARGYRGLVDIGMPQKDIARRVGRSQAHVSKRLSLLELPDVATKALSAGKLTIEDALELHKLKDMPKRIASVVRDARLGNIRWAIDREIREHERAVALGEFTQKMKEKGVTVVKRSGQHNAKERPLGKNDYRGLGIPTQKHAKEPCHGAYFDEYSKRAVYVCTDPSRHTAKGKSELKSVKPDLGTSPRRQLTPEEKAEKERRDAERAARAEASERRTTFVTELVRNMRGRRVGKDEVLGFLAEFVGTYTGFSFDEGQVRAAVAVGIVESDESTEINGAIEAYVAKSGANMQRFALATALLVYEGDVRESFGDFGPYLRFLERHGYEISDVEREQLDEVKA